MKIKTMKITGIILTLVMLVTMLGTFAITASAAETVNSGTTGDCTWTLDSEGVLTVSGQGAMANYQFVAQRPWLAHKEQIMMVVIKSGVTTVGTNAFNGCTSLESVTIPASVITIGSNAFYNCTALTTVNYFGTSAPSANSNAFSGTVIKKVNVPTTYEGDTLGGKSVSKTLEAESDEPTTYAVTATATPTEGGTVSGSGNYTEGDSVTLTVTPAEGYVLETLVVKDKDGNPVIVDENNRFVMPECDLTVEATFAKIVYATLEQLTNALTELEAKIAEGVDPDELAAEIKKVTDIIDALDESYATDKAVADAIAAAKKEVTDAYTATLDTAVEQLDKAIADGDTDLTEEIEALSNALAEAKAVLEKADADNKAELIAKIETADATLDEAIKAVPKNLDDAKAELDKAIANGDSALVDKINVLNEALTLATEVLEGEIIRNVDALTESIDGASAILESAIEAVKKSLEDAKTALEKADADNKAMLEAKDRALEAKDAELFAKDAQLAEKDQDLQIFIIIVCVISSLAFCGCGTIAVFYFIIDKKKKI